jgi:tetratricopeptide (TPR) repeat protein
MVIAAAVVIAVYRLAYLPWRADVERKRLETITVTLWERQPVFGGVRARENVGAARVYIDQGVHSVGLYMVTAANYRYLEDYDHAAEMYRMALRYERRPELYYNLGMVELSRRHPEEAKEALIRAGLFNPFLILEIEDLNIRAAVESAVATRRLLPWRAR